MERSNLFNHLLRIFDEGLSMKTTELEYGTLEVTVENRSQDKKITFLAKGMEEAKQKAAEWQCAACAAHRPAVERQAPASRWRVTRFFRSGNCP